MRCGVIMSVLAPSLILANVVTDPQTVDTHAGLPYAARGASAPSWLITMLALLLAPRLAAVLHSRLSRRAVGSSAALCSSLVLPRAAAASDFQTAEAATASQFAAAEEARAARQRDSLQLRRGFELKLSAVQDATTAREFVAASDALARVENTAGCAWLARHAVTIGECDAG